MRYWPLERISAYAQKGDLALFDAVAALLQEGILPEHFRRNSGLVSLEQQLRLFRLPVFLAGCGGLGGEMAAHLAQMGAANIYLCDYDRFEESNLNRQRFCSCEVIGQPKAQTTADKLLAKAPWGKFTAVPSELNEDNAQKLMEPAAIVIDCLDSVGGKIMLEEAAAKRHKAWLHGSILHHEGFACLKPVPGGILQTLYGDSCSQSGAGSTLSHVVAGTAAIMASLFIKWLADPSFASELIHADFSIPEMETFPLC